MAFDRLFGVFKRGDQVSVLGKEYLSVKNGMLVSYIDEMDYNLPLESIISRRMREVYFFLPFPREMKSMLADGQRAIGQTFKMPGFEIPDLLKFRPKKYVIDIADLAGKTGDPLLVSKLKSGESISVLSNAGLPFSQEVLKSSLIFANAKALDVKSISAGTWDVGTAGDYLTWYLFILDWTHLTGNLTGKLISNVTEVTGDNHCALNLNGYEISMDNDSPPVGDPTAGYITSLGFTHTIWLNFHPTNTGTIKVKNQNIKEIQAKNQPYAFFAPYNTHKFKIEDTVMKVSNAVGVGDKGVALYPGDTATIIELFNVIASNNGYDTGYGLITLEFGVSTSSIIENCSLVNALGYGINLAGYNITMRNNFCGLNTGADFLNHSNTTGYNNASEDATGANANWKAGSADNLSGLTVADEFESTDITNADFMKVKSDGSCGDGGSAPSLADNDHGIRGNPRGH